MIARRCSTPAKAAAIFRGHGPAWREANRGHASLEQLKVMSAIGRCRTAALGGHVARCENAACGHTLIAYNSCLMGKLRNGELAEGRIGLIVDFIDFRSTLRTALGLNAQEPQQHFAAVKIDTVTAAPPDGPQYSADPVAVATALPAVKSRGRIEIDVAGARIRVENGVDRATLAMVLAAVRGDR
jgi:Transposase zinc-binding domain